MREQSFLSYSLRHKNHVLDIREITCVESEKHEAWNASGYQELAVRLSAWARYSGAYG
jgi:hypothetical protein